MTEFFRGFPLSLQVNTGLMYLKIRPRPLPTKSFPIHYSLIDPSFDAKDLVTEKKTS
jgi:hypothetical protein